MGSSEADAPSNAVQKNSEQPPPAANSSSPAPVAYPDWSGFQAYSPIPPHGFFPSPAASSPQAHPYMWGPQHMMPPYGTPPHPYMMYPPGGLYAHPSMPPGSHPFGPYAMLSPNGNAEASGAAAGIAEVDSKSSEGKERSPIKRSKGSLGSLNMITGKTNNELGKTSETSANGVYSQSGESGTEGSSESDTNSQNDSQPKTGGGQDSVEAESSQNGTQPDASQNGSARAPSQAVLNQTMAVADALGVVAGPTTNLNIGMDYWGTPTPSTIPLIRGKVPGTSGSGAVVSNGIPGSRDSIPSEHWMQDERELKRQKRKQSNRESARRSRLRKQAECEELAQRVEVLKDENSALRAELDQIKKEYDQLLAHNTSLKERLGGTPNGTEDTRLDRKDQNSGNGPRKRADSDAPVGQTDTVQSGR